MGMPRQLQLPRAVTPDGRFLVFTSNGALTPDDTRGNGAAQVYEYDAQVGTLTRVSIAMKFRASGALRAGGSPPIAR
jgi:Tol biopolymer transport system component